MSSDVFKYFASWPLSELLDLVDRLDEALKYKNRFHLQPTDRKIVQLFVKFSAHFHSVELLEGFKLCRARIHAVNQSEKFPPQLMLAPPKELTKSGRLNPPGIPFLYAAKNANIALHEIRPWVGARVSIARLRLLNDVKVVDLYSPTAVHLFDKNRYSRQHDYFDNVYDGARSPLGQKYHFVTLRFIERYFTYPQHSLDNAPYIVSQYIAELFSIMGFDGICYPSALSTGENVALFSDQQVEVTSVELRKVVQVSCTCEKVT